MSSARIRGASNKNLVLAAMVFAVAMTFIDQTIVAIAIPKIQKELSLSPTGSQWVINGYLLALSALFAFGGKLGDVLGRRRMVLIGVIGFALASAACGLTPKGAIAAGLDHLLPGRSRVPRRRCCSRPRWRSWSPRSRCASAARRWRSSSASRAG